MALKRPQMSLKTWTKQKWRTPSGKPSIQGPKATGEVYAPSATIASTKRSKLAAATRVKRQAIKQGEQFAQHGLHEGKNRSGIA